MPDALPPEISVDAYAALRHQPAPPLLLDVREAWEADLASIPGATLVPMGDIPSRLQELDPDRPTVVLCHHGACSLNVTMWLRQQASSTSNRSPAASISGPAPLTPPSPATKRRHLHLPAVKRSPASGPTVSSARESGALPPLR